MRGNLCNVLNCGDGNCCHSWTGFYCPDCGFEIKQAAHETYNYWSCSNHEMICDLEGKEDEIKGKLKRES